MNWSKLSVQQKLLMLVGGVVMVAATLLLLSIWGINLGETLVARVLGTCVLIAVVAGMMIAIISNMRDAKKDDKDNFYN